MRKIYYDLGQKDAYYGLTPFMLAAKYWTPSIREAYLNGYADYLECVA